MQHAPCSEYTEQRASLVIKTNFRGALAWNCGGSRINVRAARKRPQAYTQRKQRRCDISKAMFFLLVSGLGFYHFPQGTTAARSQSQVTGESSFSASAIMKLAQPGAQSKNQCMFVRAQGTLTTSYHCTWRNPCYLSGFVYGTLPECRTGYRATAGAPIRHFSDLKIAIRTALMI